MAKAKAKAKARTRASVSARSTRRAKAAPPREAAPPRWRCPGCGRRFGRAQQSHTCQPGLLLDEYLSRQPAAHAPIYRAALARLAALGDIDVDPVGVGIMVKRTRTFCELRPKRSGVELAFKLSRSFADPRIRRTIHYSTHRVAYFVLLESPADVDDTLGGWLAEAYLDSPR
jgi:hypothetical protein